MKFLTAALLLFALLPSSKVFAVETGILELASDHKVFYRYQKAEAGKPTVVLMNGLIYAIENWEEYVTELSQDGTGVLQIAYSTQPESLAFLGKEAPFFSEIEISLWGYKQKGLETQVLVDESMAVIDRLGIEKFSLLSLSYGSIVASELAVQNKERIEKLILIAPAVVTSGRYNAYGQSRHAYYSLLKAAGNPAADYYYDLEIYNTLSMLVTPQKYQFDLVDFSYFFDGVYQMARSSKWCDLKDYATQELPDTYLFLATLEDAPLLKDQKKFWELMDVNPAKKSLVVFQGSYHAIPGVAPEAAAEQTRRVISDALTAAETTVKVGTGNPGGTLKNSLLNYTR